MQKIDESGAEQQVQTSYRSTNVLISRSKRIFKNLSDS